MENKIRKNDGLLDQHSQLNEIRTILVKSFLVFVSGCIAGLLLNRKIILLIMSRFDLEQVNVVLTSPTQFINLAVKIAVICGLITTIPVLGYYLLKYAKPALKLNEYKLIKRILPISIFLFILGSGFGGWIEQFIVTMYSKTTIDFKINNVWDVETFLSQFLTMSLVMGLVFELPIVLTIFIRLKMISIERLVKQRKYVYCGLILLAILLPPTDIVSLSLVTAPLWILFEVTLLLNRDN